MWAREKTHAAVSRQGITLPGTNTLSYYILTKRNIADKDSIVASNAIPLALARSRHPARVIEPLGAIGAEIKGNEGVAQLDGWIGANVGRERVIDIHKGKRLTLRSRGIL